MITTRKRLDPSIFDLPVEKMRAGWYTDAYFNHTRDALLEDGRHPIGVMTEEQASWWGGSGLGTVPHALIAAYGGNSVAAAKHFANWAPDDMNITVLVDFENDSVRTAIDVARALGPRLWGVRLDTSESLVDRSLWEEMGDFKPTGVNPQLVWKVRKALDDEGFESVRIVVSGGFTVEKIAQFEED